MTDTLHVVDGLVSIAIVLQAFAQFIVAILLIGVLWYLIGILRAIRAMAERMERGSEMISGDLFQMRHALKEQGAELWAGAKGIFQAIPHILGFDVRKKRSRKKKDDESESAPETDE